MCSHGNKVYGTDFVSLSEYAAAQGLADIDFEGDAPEGICSYCWSNTKTTLEEEREQEAKGCTIGSAQSATASDGSKKGAPGKDGTTSSSDRRRPWRNWTRSYAGSVRSTTSTSDVRSRRGVSGLEYQRRSDHQHSNPSDTMASERTIAEIATQATLWEGDRPSLIHDFGTPAHHYCIVKEVYEPEEIDTLGRK